MKTSLPSSSSGWMFFLFPHPTSSRRHLSSFPILFVIQHSRRFSAAATRTILAFELTSLNASLIHFHFIIAPTTTIARLLNWWRLKTFSKRLRDDENLMMKKYFSFPSHADDDDGTMMSENRNRVWERRRGKFSVFFSPARWMRMNDMATTRRQICEEFSHFIANESWKLNVNDDCEAADLTSTKRKLWELREEMSIVVDDEMIRRFSARFKGWMRAQRAE